MPSGLMSLAKYMAVASPSTVGLVAIMTSWTVSFRRASSSLMHSCSAPTPSMGEIRPCSTWYRPLYSWVRSMDWMSRGLSTTQMTDLSRLGDAQMPHTSPAV